MLPVSYPGTFCDFVCRSRKSIRTRKAGGRQPVLFFPRPAIPSSGGNFSPAIDLPRRTSCMGMACRAVPSLTTRPIGTSFPSLRVRQGSCNRRLRLLEKFGKRGCRRVSFPHRSDWFSRRRQIHHRFSHHHLRPLRPQRLSPHGARSPRIYSQTNSPWDYNLQVASESHRSAN